MLQKRLDSRRIGACLTMPATKMRHFPCFKQHTLIGRTISRMLIGRTQSGEICNISNRFALKNKKLSFRVSESRVTFIVPMSNNSKRHE